MKKLYFTLVFFALAITCRAQQKIVVFNESNLLVKIVDVLTHPTTYDPLVPNSEYPNFVAKIDAPFQPYNVKILENTQFNYSIPLNKFGQTLAVQYWYSHTGVNSGTGPMTKNQANTLAGGTTPTNGQRLNFVDIEYYDTSTTPPTLLPFTSRIGPNYSTYDTDGVNFEIYYYESGTGSNKQYSFYIDDL